jgi:hypothetical protein
MTSGASVFQAKINMKKVINCLTKKKNTYNSNTLCLPQRLGKTAKFFLPEVEKRLTKTS